jgi:hypothetical protein
VREFHLDASQNAPQNQIESKPDIEVIEWSLRPLIADVEAKRLLENKELAEVIVLPQLELERAFIR